jgi:hypothetical protein
MAWSIFSNGGGDGAAVTWAEDFLSQLGAPVTPGNEQFVYDWEQSEGGGGEYNPLNEGPVPGQPQLTTTGSQYGGGAADYASYAAGIQGAVDYLDMSNYTQVKAALMANNPTEAEQALFASPWAASHYGYGSSFSAAPLPGQATSLIGDTGNAAGASDTTGSVQSANWFTNLFTVGGQEQDLKNLFGSSGSGAGSTPLGTTLQKFAVRAGLILLGGIILIIGLLRLTGSEKSVGQAVMLPATGAKAAVRKIGG